MAVSITLLSESNSKVTVIVLKPLFGSQGRGLRLQGASNAAWLAFLAFTGFAVALHEAEPLNPHLLAYINRLSDYLFVLARVANDGGKGDVNWIPGANR